MISEASSFPPALSSSAYGLVVGVIFQCLLPAFAKQFPKKAFIAPAMYYILYDNLLKALCSVLFDFLMCLLALQVCHRIQDIPIAVGKRNSKGLVHSPFNYLLCGGQSAKYTSNTFFPLMVFGTYHSDFLGWHIIFQIQVNQATLPGPACTQSRRGMDRRLCCPWN